MNDKGVTNDIWECISRHLSVRDLCRAMQVSKEWLDRWKSDRMWITHKRRVLDKYPELQEMGIVGTQHFFNTCLNFGFDPLGFKRLCDEGSHPLAIAVAKSLLPPHSHQYANISVTTMEDSPFKGVLLVFAHGKSIFVRFDYDVNNTYLFFICRQEKWPHGWITCHNFRLRNSFAQFDVWKALVFGDNDKNATEKWCQDFIDFVVKK